MAGFHHLFERRTQFWRNKNNVIKIILVDLPHNRVFFCFYRGGSGDAGNQCNFAKGLTVAQGGDAHLLSMFSQVGMNAYPAGLDQVQSIAQITLAENNSTLWKSAFLDVAYDPANLLRW